MAMSMSLPRFVFRGTANKIFSGVPKPIRLFSTSVIKKGGASPIYRSAFKNPTPKEERVMIIVNGFMWWWVFHGFFTDPWTALGHSPTIDYDKLTNEELGIPSDDFE